jgi:hypothetical protein
LKREKEGALFNPNYLDPNKLQDAKKTAGIPTNFGVYRSQSDLELYSPGTVAPPKN